jgi:uncharacterized membrane protein
MAADAKDHIGTEFMPRTKKQADAQTSRGVFPHARPRRFQAVDALRGSAILLMFIYHFIFDLNMYRVVDYPIYTGTFWIAFRTVIVVTFLTLVGVSLHLAYVDGFKPKPFSRRFLQILIYAGLVSLGTYLFTPRAMVYFGILHFIAAASVLGLLFLPFYRLNLALGAGLIVLGLVYQHPWFDEPWLRFIGLMTHKPHTLDYVPLLPWFGVVLIGIFLGKTVFGFKDVAQAEAAQWQSDLAPVRLLAFGGRHSLNIYLLHQPIFVGLVILGLKIHHAV